jgi:hypothetical protein
VVIFSLSRAQRRNPIVPMSPEVGQEYAGPELLPRQESLHSGKLSIGISENRLTVHPDQLQHHIEMVRLMYQKKLQPE